MVIHDNFKNRYQIEKELKESPGGMLLYKRFFSKVKRNILGSVFLILLCIPFAWLPSIEYVSKLAVFTLVVLSLHNIVRNLSPHPDTVIDKKAKRLFDDQETIRDYKVTLVRDDGDTTSSKIKASQSSIHKLSRNYKDYDTITINGTTLDLKDVVNLKLIEHVPDTIIYNQPHWIPGRFDY